MEQLDSEDMQNEEKQDFLGRGRKKDSGVCVHRPVDGGWGVGGINDWVRGREQHG